MQRDARKRDLTVAQAFVKFAHELDLALGRAYDSTQAEASVFLTGVLDVWVEEVGGPWERRCFSTDEAYVAGRNAAMFFLTSEERAERRRP